jgi:hypothetical protein
VQVSVRNATGFLQHHKVAASIGKEQLVKEQVVIVVNSA